MARYIDADKLKEHIKNYGKGAIADGHYALDPVDDIVAIAGIVDFMPTADVVPKKEIAREIITEIADICKGEDSVNISFAIGYMSAMNKVLDKLAELKKKYTGG